MKRDIQSKNLKIILDSLREGFDLSVYNFENDTAIIKDIKANQMYICNICFLDNKAFFIDITKKDENFLTTNDILKS